MVAVDIEVQDDLTAVFSITKKPESSSYYTLDKPTAKAGELVTATLTDAGVRADEGDAEQECMPYIQRWFTYSCLPAEIYRIQAANGPLPLRCRRRMLRHMCILGTKSKVTLNGTDKEVDYDGTPKSVGDEIQATISGTGSFGTVSG